MKIPAPELDRVIQNVLLFADEKAMRLNEIFFVASEDLGFVSFSCDDYVAVTDSCPADFHLKEFALTISDVDKLGEWIKKDKKVVHKFDIDIRPKMTGIIFECIDTSTDEESDNLFFSYVIPNYSSWDTVFDILNEENPGMSIPSFAIRPERLSKLWRLKADKEAPIHLRGVELKDKLLIQFKKGKTLRGAIMPVDLDYVAEEYRW